MANKLKYAVVELRIPWFDEDFAPLPVEVTTYVGNRVIKREGELTPCDGLDTAVFDGTPLHSHARRVAGTAHDDLDNFSHFTPGEHIPAFQNAVLWALHDWGTWVWYPDDLERELIRSLPGYTNDVGGTYDPWGDAPWERISSTREDGVLIYTYRRYDD